MSRNSILKYIDIKTFPAVTFNIILDIDIHQVTYSTKINSK